MISTARNRVIFSRARGRLIANGLGTGLIVRVKRPRLD